ncbi:MAG: hypothetical protein ACR5KV_06570 [Wolbachia sp.]
MFDKIKEAAQNRSELSRSLKKEIRDLLKSGTKYGFKPSLNTPLMVMMKIRLLKLLLKLAEIY